FVFIIQKDIDAVIPPLGDMMWIMGHYDTGDSRHEKFLH
ncbi:hypothetical protein SAMN04489760_105176, partial [Syntrophus gentianae]